MAVLVSRRDKEVRPARPRRRAAKIIEAAAAVFAELGYHGATTRDLADRLGMRQGSLYYYFPSKEAALEQVCLRGAGDFVARALEVVHGPGGAAEKLVVFIRRHLEPMETRPTFVRCFLRERRFLPKESRRRIGRVARRYERCLQSIIEAGIASGEIGRDVNPRLTVLALLGMCNLAVEWIGKEPGATVAEAADAFARIATRGILAQKPGRQEPAPNRRRASARRRSVRA